MSISVVLPAYKEAENLEFILPNLNGCLKKIGCEYEILVIDTIMAMDNTEQVCEKHGANCISRKDGNSYGDAIRTGIKSANKSYILVMDSDGSHNPDDISRLYDETKNGYDLVIGSRYIKGGKTNNNFMLRFMSKTVNVIYRLVFKLSVKDVSNSFRLYKSEKIKKLSFECDNFDIVEEILIRLSIGFEDFSVIEIPVYFDKRVYGETKRHLFKFALSYIKTIKHLLTIKENSKRDTFDG